MRYAVEIARVVMHSDEPITPERRESVLRHLRAGYVQELILDNIIEVVASGASDDPA